MTLLRNVRISLISLPAIIVGKIVRFVLRFVFHQGGSALPGRIVEVLDKGFLYRIMSKFPYGVVLVTGTNGKTTTTHFITQLLQYQGLRVFTNRSGSNYTRGIISELLHQVSILGNPRADLAVLELDEAYGVQFSQIVKPRISVFLNIMRDQLDRFGELSYTFELLCNIAKNTSEIVILNSDDNYIKRIAEVVKSTVSIQYFNANSQLRNQYFVNDDELYKKLDIPPNIENDGSILTKQVHSRYGQAVVDQALSPFHTTTLNDFRDGEVVYLLNRHEIIGHPQISGIHNLLNSAVSISATYAILDQKIDGAKLIDGINSLTATFGRGEVIVNNSVEYELILVKNPAGFRIALKSFEPDTVPVMVLINDDYADGRDVSWLYDVDFTVFKEKFVDLSDTSLGTTIGGNRAWDLALKFKYTDNPIQSVNQDIKLAWQSFTNLPKVNTPAGTIERKRIYATYTAMLAVRSLLLNKRGSTL